MSHVKGTTNLIDVFGMFECKSGIGADWIIEIAELRFGSSIIRIDLWDKNPVKKSAGFVMFTDFAEFLSECDAGICEVLGVAGFAIGKSGSLRQGAEGGAEFIHSHLEILFGIGFATIDKQTVCLGDSLLTTDDFTLCQSAHPRIIFSGVRRGKREWHSSGGGHQSCGCSAVVVERIFLHKERSCLVCICELWKEFFK